MSDIERYDYDLPKELIAQEPAIVRTDARLLIVDRETGKIEHRHIRDLPEYLEPNDALVLNDTRVVPARLVGKRTETGGRWEGLFLDATEDGYWHVLATTRGKIRRGETVTIPADNPTDDLVLHLVEKLEDGSWIVSPESEEHVFALLDRVGRVPLPHYIRGGDMEPSDKANYQTIYAERPGAVAAPTAGLHFTESLLEEIERQGVVPCRLTLHVGLGTFRPISVDSLDQHEMHHEWGELLPETVHQIEACQRKMGRVVAVGTTSVRLLETAAADGTLRPFFGETDLFIRPPYEFKVVDALLTNFHFPKTTLLVLVRTFGGDELIMRAYQEAIQRQYRFFSYGDAMLIL